jgi:hypothetical protein
MNEFKENGRELSNKKYFLCESLTLMLKFSVIAAYAHAVMYIRRFFSVYVVLLHVRDLSAD